MTYHAKIRVLDAMFIPVRGGRPAHHDEFVSMIKLNIETLKIYFFLWMPLFFPSPVSQAITFIIFKMGIFFRRQGQRKPLPLFFYIHFDRIPNYEWIVFLNDKVT